MECPSLIILLDYVRDQLSADERAALQSHLFTGCPSCQGNQRWMVEVLRLASEDRSFEFPEETIKQVVAQFKNQSATSSSSIQILAQLVFDSMIPRQLADVRSDLTQGSAVTGRQMLFQAGGYDIDLRFEQAENSEVEEMIGQILPQEQRPAEISHFSAQLLRGETEIDRAQTDARGIFKFARVPSGVYNLKIQVPEGEINIRDVPTACGS